ncbi:hypothetical protein C8Q76DRAFT_294609 [Earliella scabrosa]|nr:hypothetical protein C8Q76DRAFT_294609 [Earliella scabrosa]
MGNSQSSSNGIKDPKEVSTDILDLYWEVARLRSDVFTTRLETEIAAPKSSSTLYPFRIRRILCNLPSHHVHPRLSDVVNGQAQLIDTVKASLHGLNGSSVVLNGIALVLLSAIKALNDDSNPETQCEKIFLTVGSVGGVYRVDVQLSVYKLQSNAFKDRNIQDVIISCVVVSSPDVMGMTRQDVRDHISQLLHGSRMRWESLWQQVEVDIWNAVQQSQGAPIPLKI